MKTIITIFLICFNSFAFCQTGKVKIGITITDTVKPYFLDIFAWREKKIVSKITVIQDGVYLIKDLPEGYYKFEFHSFESRSRILYIDSVKVFNDSTTVLKVIYPGPCKFIYTQGLAPECPYNHTDKIVRILYGYPTKKMMKKAKKGLIFLGGCTISDCDPRYYCTLHKIEI